MENKHKNLIFFDSPRAPHSFAFALVLIRDPHEKKYSEKHKTIYKYL